MVCLMGRSQLLIHVGHAHIDSCRSRTYSVTTYRFVVIRVLSTHDFGVCVQYNSRPQIERHMHFFRFVTGRLAKFSG